MSVDWNPRFAYVGCRDSISTVTKRLSCVVSSAGGPLVKGFGVGVGVAVEAGVALDDGDALEAGDALDDGDALGVAVVAGVAVGVGVGQLQVPPLLSSSSLPS
jgi:hypothetical protein